MPIVKFLRGMPIPATHPSQGIARTLMDAQRGNWSVKCLDVQGKRLVVRVGMSEVDPLQTRR
jgi:exocyst complex protein 7